jgi:hypothetical protein
MHITLFAFVTVAAVQHLRNCCCLYPRQGKYFDRVAPLLLVLTLRLRVIEERRKLINGG